MRCATGCDGGGPAARAGRSCAAFVLRLSLAARNLHALGSAGATNWRQSWRGRQLRPASGKLFERSKLLRWFWVRNWRSLRPLFAANSPDSAQPSDCYAISSPTRCLADGFSRANPLPTCPSLAGRPANSSTSAQRTDQMPTGDRRHNLLVISSRQPSQHQHHRQVRHSLSVIPKDAQGLP